jgi:hypothetical protein
MNRREWLGGAVAAAVTGGFGLRAQQKSAAPARRSILNFNENMDYRKLGKTGLMVSAVCLGGHWKRVGTCRASPQARGYCKQDMENLITRVPEEPPRDREPLTGWGSITSTPAPPRNPGLQPRAEGPPRKMYSAPHGRRRSPATRNTAACPNCWKLDGPEVRGSSVDIWRITLPQDGLPDLGD